MLLGEAAERYAVKSKTGLRRDWRHGNAEIRMRDARLCRTWRLPKDQLKLCDAIDSLADRHHGPAPVLNPPSCQLDLSSEDISLDLPGGTLQSLANANHNFNRS